MAAALIVAAAAVQVWVLGAVSQSLPDKSACMQTDTHRPKPFSVHGDHGSSPCLSNCLISCLQLMPHAPCAGTSEYVRGLTLLECATLLNVDSKDIELMSLVYDTALSIKNRIYGNRIVLFAPLYIANYCVNSCTYCAFRAGNKTLQASLVLHCIHRIAHDFFARLL
jgi:hypothetical protein